MHKIQERPVVSLERVVGELGWIQGADHTDVPMLGRDAVAFFGIYPLLEGFIGLPHVHIARQQVNFAYAPPLRIDDDENAQ